MIGRTLSSYTIIGDLGAGGMGAVYLAKDTRLGRTVALKVLPQDVATDESRRQRFLLEARSASQIKHPNVAHVYDVGEEDGISFIVMEHVEGETLYRRMAARSLSVEEAIRIGLQVADALADAHEKQITHRDIKPANIMLTDRDQVKVLDFGLARLGRDAELTVDLIAETVSRVGEGSQELTSAGQLLGTIPYMSPEQARGQTVGPATDVFSLGIVLYEMLAGCRPFDALTPEETLARILEGNPVPLPTINPEVPEPLCHVVETCLAPSPHARYPTARGLFDALEQVLQSGPGAHDEPTAASTVNAIAVMPFENRSQDEEAGYLCDGMADSLISKLSKLPDLRVMSRHASFALRHKSLDLRSLGERLEVDALVVGDLSPRGDRMVMNVELVAVPAGDRLWGETYDRPMSDAVLVEKDVADKVSLQIRNALSRDEVNDLISESVDPQAYLLYLKGRSLLVGSDTQMKKGAQYLEEAAEKDPGYALPHAAMVESCMMRAYHNTLDITEASRRARVAARTAARLAPDLPESQMALGIVRFMFDWDWDGADEAFRNAISMGPGKDAPHYEYAEFLSAMGRLPEALAMAEKARQIDPVSPNPTHTEAYTYMLMGDYEKAIERFRAAIDLHPNWLWGHIKLANSLSRSNRHEEALTEIRLAEAQLSEGGTSLAWSWVGRVYAAAGLREKSDEILQELRKDSVDPVTRVYLYSPFGEKDKVLEALEEGYRMRSALTAMLLPVSCLEPSMDLWKEERFLDLVRRMGLPEKPPQMTEGQTRSPRRK